MVFIIILFYVFIMSVSISQSPQKESCIDYDGVYISQSPQRESCVDNDGVYISQSPQRESCIDYMVYIKVPSESRM